MIRRAGLEDLSSLMDIERRCFRSGRFSEEVYVTCLVRADSEVWLLEEGGQAAGSLVLVLSAGPGLAHLISVAVRAEYRGGGRGRALMLWAEERARRHGARGVRLEVRLGNRRARGLYRSLGYREAARLRHYYGRGRDGVLCVKDFSGESTFSPEPTS